MVIMEGGCHACCDRSVVRREHPVIAYAILVIAAFLVTWTVIDRLHMRRTRYVAILALLALTWLGAELAWSGTSL